MQTLLLLLSVQGLIGAYDSIYHHDFKEKLSLKPSAKEELKIHSIRSMLYSILFLSIAWIEWHGWLVLGFTLIILIELVLTLWDFVEEDRSRVLPATERITHTILTLNFGAIIALFIPELIHWRNQLTEFTFVNHGIYSWIMTVYGIGVIPFAIREYKGYLYFKRTSTEPTNPLTTFPSIPSQNILISGATGFIGQQLCQALLAQGHTLTLLVRDFHKAASMFDGHGRIALINSIEQLKETDIFDSVINLAGEPIANGRWNQHKKLLILDSRLNTTQQIIEFIKRVKIKPQVLISGSAIGYYGPRDDEVITELSEGRSSFSHDLCAQWETLAQQAKHYGVRVCLLRTGIVLGKTGGALASMLIPYSYGLGGKLGHGRQWMSWIHIDDVVGIIFKLLEDTTVSGPVNITAPNPITNKEFTKILGKHLHRPTIMTMPALVLRLLFAELADELLLSGQKVFPKKIEESGYSFLYPALTGAITAIVNRS